MSDAFNTFMREIIDYAGLFPPASLELDPAVRNYLRYRGESHAWMLGRFIVTAGGIGDLAAIGRDLPFSPGLAINLCLILGGDENTEAAIQHARNDVEAIRSTASGSGGALLPDGFEVRFPGQAVADGEWLPFLSGMRAAIEDSGLRGVELFVEIPQTVGWRSSDRAAIEAVAAFAHEYPDDEVLRRIGVKLRCGGTEAGAFPPVERIAGVLADCRDHHVPVKFTAGLHHPVRAFDPELDVKQHGFLNVFGAGILAWALNMTDADLADVLREEDTGAFRFDGDRFLWRDRAVSAAQVERGREMFVTAFGSCSFDEPIADLAALGMTG
jgi:hypothetical protein